MVPELGLILLICAAVLSASGAIAGCFAWGERFASTQLYATIASVLLSLLLLAWSFFNVDLTVAIVYAQAHADLPWYYRISALWGGHEGSMLLWICILSLWCAYAARMSRHTALYTKVCVLLNALLAGLLSFEVFTSNPFARYLPMQPLTGQDLNPLLQDGLMVIHPPILYAGYVGFAIPFVFAVACLWNRTLSLDAMKMIRKTALLALAFLTLGITLGSFWAYYELGWGGWWFWDPVENASLMPWLSGLALVHVVSLSIHRQQYQAWMLFLCILTFALSLLGTFLVRSGILTSVHSFAADPTRGFYILGLLTVYMIPALYLYARRASSLSQHKPYIMSSREGLMLVNSGLFMAMMATVSLGTLYPLILEALNKGFISVGAPYFNAVMSPIFFIAVVAMLIAGFSRWGKPLELHSMIHVKLSGLRHRTLSFWGMCLAHAGVIVFMIGVLISSQQGISKDVRMRVNDTVVAGDYHITLDSLSGVKGENYDAMQAHMTVRDDDFQATLLPQKRFYFAREQFISQTAIHGTLTRDIYIALAQPVGDAWDVRIYIKPFQRWIWAGGLLIMLGAGLSFYDKRYLR